MNSKGINVLNNKEVCMVCQKEKATNTYSIYGRGYGSDFDNFNTKFQCCDNCNKDEYKDWFYEKCVIDGYDETETYKHEDDIYDLINSLSLNSQELFYNTFSDGAFTHWFDAQDWIDYKLNELPHKKCKEYGMYSPQEKQAYADRFPTCNNTYKKVYKDGSSSCCCNYGASGNYDGICGIDISEECYMCTNYELRKDDMKVVNVSEEMLERERERLIEMIKYATENLEKIKNGTYFEED